MKKKENSLDLYDIKINENKLINDEIDLILKEIIY
jgi:hypothetical protein